MYRVWRDTAECLHDHRDDRGALVHSSQVLRRGHDNQMNVSSGMAFYVAFLWACFCVCVQQHYYMLQHVHVLCVGWPQGGSQFAIELYEWGSTGVPRRS